MSDQMTRYATKADALADGWISIRDAATILRGPKVHAPWGIADEGRYLSIRDISGGHSYGYEFGVFLSSQDFLGFPKQPCHLRSTTVWFSEDKNKIGRPGCFREMFLREEIESLMEDFPAVLPTPAEAPPVTQEELNWSVFRFSNWLAFQCPPAEREALAELTPAAVRRMLEIKRRPLATVSDEMIQHALANPGVRCQAIEAN